MLVWLCVALRIATNPCSNVLQKLLTRQNAHPLGVVCATHGLLSIVCLPICIVDSRSLSLAFWLEMLVCTLVGVAGNVLLVEALKRSELSILGPINAYKSVVSLVPAMLLLGEIPSPLGLAGVVLVVAGSFGLVDRDAGTPRLKSFALFLADRGIQLRFGALLFSATEAVIFKQALRETSALTAFAFWSVLGFGVSLMAVALLWSKGKLTSDLGILRTNAITCTSLAVTTGVMQFCTAVTLERLQVGYSLALFQISTIITVILGHRMFQEGHFLKRLGGAAIMAAGAVLILGSR